MKEQVISNSRRGSRNEFSQAIVHIGSASRPRDTGLANLSWTNNFSSFFPATKYGLRPPKSCSGGAASSCRGRFPSQPGLAPDTWIEEKKLAKLKRRVHFAKIHFGFPSRVEKSGKQYCEYCEGRNPGDYCALLCFLSLPGEEVALRVADTDVLALTHQQVVSLLTVANLTQNIIKDQDEEYPTH